MKKAYYKFLLHAPLARVREHLERRGDIVEGDTPIFTAAQADWRPGRGGAHNVKEFRGELCALIKERGAHKHAEDLLLSYKLELQRQRERLREQGITTEGISDDERAEVYAAWGLAPPAAGVRSGS